MNDTLTVNAFVPIPRAPSTGKAFLWGLGAFVIGVPVLIGLLSGRFELFMALVAVGWMVKNAARAAQTSRFEHRQVTLSVDAGVLSVTIPRYKWNEPQTVWLFDPGKAPISAKADSRGLVTICYGDQPYVQLKLASGERVRLDAFLSKNGVSVL